MLSVAKRNQVAREYFAGVAPSEIAAEHGLSVTHVVMIAKRHDDARYRLASTARRQREDRDRRARELIERRAATADRIASGFQRTEPRPEPEGWQYAPADTRSLTAAILGDPLPGRSALDKRLSQGRNLKEER